MKPIISIAAKTRAERLRKMAHDAIKQYNEDSAKGGEPAFPDWALEMLGVLTDYERMADALAHQHMAVVKVIDFTNGKHSDSIVHRVPS